MRAMLIAYRVLGPRGLRFIVYPAVFVFFLFSPETRRVSMEYLRREATYHRRPEPQRLDVYRHLVSFVFSMFEKIAAWSDDIDLTNIRFGGDDVRELQNLLEDGRGAVLICAHIGNVELLRALATQQKTGVIREIGVTSIVDFGGTEEFNKLIRMINPLSMIRLIGAASVGIETVLDLQRRLEEGELVAIAADRTAAENRDTVVRVPFLGADAPFPQGVFVLAGLLEAPVFFMFGVRERDLDPASPYVLHVSRARSALDGPRKDRYYRVRRVVEEYVDHLERLCRDHPFQWYNFFDFWDAKGGTDR